MQQINMQAQNVANKAANVTIRSDLPKIQQKGSTVSDSTSRQVFSRLSRSHTVASIGKIVPEPVRVSAEQEKQHTESQRRSNESPRPGPSNGISHNHESRATSPPPPYSPGNSSITFSRGSLDWPDNQNEVVRSKIPIPTARNSRRIDNLSRTVCKNDIQSNDENFDDTMSMASTTDDVFASVGRKIALAFESHESSLADIEIPEDLMLYSADTDHDVENKEDFDIILRNHISRYTPVHDSDAENELALVEQLEQKYQAMHRNTTTIAAEAIAALTSTPENFMQNIRHSPLPEPHYPSLDNSSPPKNETLERKLRSTLADGDKILEANELELQKLENEEPKGSMIDVEKNNRELRARLSESQKSRNRNSIVVTGSLVIENGNLDSKESPNPNCDLLSALELLEIEAHILESEKLVEFKRLEAEKLRIEAEICKRSLLQVRTELNRAKKERNMPDEKEKSFEIDIKLDDAPCPIPYSEKPTTNLPLPDPEIKSRISAEMDGASKPVSKPKSKKKKAVVGFLDGVLLP